MWLTRAPTVQWHDTVPLSLSVSARVEARGATHLALEAEHANEQAAAAWLEDMRKWRRGRDAASPETVETVA